MLLPLTLPHPRISAAAILVSYAAVSERRGSRNIPERRKKCAAGNTHMSKAAAKEPLPKGYFCVHRAEKGIIVFRN